ncbi:MAG: hypothetical protein IPJ94_24485 [Chloroflexi bacterium]|nr:hypothetical protein [Chloroflexota bacterium]
MFVLPFFEGVSEWQLPDEWRLADEGPNNLVPGSGGNFLRPEVRLLASADLPPGEREQFVFDGQKTIKAFKGDAPTNFAIYTDVALQPGTYRFTIRFFPDTVIVYDGGKKVFSQEPWRPNTASFLQHRRNRVVSSRGGRCQHPKLANLRSASRKQYASAALFNWLFRWV